MQPLTYQQTSGFSPTAVINRSQIKQVPGHEKIRDAVRAWSAADNQDVVAALIHNECGDRKSTRLNSSHPTTSRMPSSA